MHSTLLQPSIHSTFCSQQSEAWSKTLSNFSGSSVYQSWEYGAVHWGQTQMEHAVFVQNGTTVGAAQLRVTRIPGVRVGIAHAPWAPLWRTGEANDHQTLLTILTLLRHEYSVRRGLTIRMTPAIGKCDNVAEYVSSAFCEAGFLPDLNSPQHATIVVRLHDTPDIIRKNLNQKWRNQLNQAERNGLSLRIGNDTKSFDEFIPIYDGMKLRKGFQSGVDVRRFRQIQAIVPKERRMPVFLALKDGQTVAGLICSHIGNMAVCLLAATNENARELKAAFFLQWQAILWLRERGVVEYDLGGVDKESNPGGFHFKSGLGGEYREMLPAYISHGSALSSLALRAARYLRQRRRSS